MVMNELLALLTEARQYGFLGPGPVEAHLILAETLEQSVPNPPALAIDLGSGGGVPGLVLALKWQESSWILLDAAERRTTFLRDAVVRLGMDARVRVVRARAEEAGRDSTLRATADLVVARSFGAPAVTAECGAPFLGVGGRLVVTEPPVLDVSRWPADGLRQLGLTVEARGPSPGAWVALRAERLCPEKFPRRTGQPSKAPLW